MHYFKSGTPGLSPVREWQPQHHVVLMLCSVVFLISKQVVCLCIVSCVFVVVCRPAGALDVTLSTLSTVILRGQHLLVFDPGN